MIFNKFKLIKKQKNNFNHFKMADSFTMDRLMKDLQKGKLD